MSSRILVLVLALALAGVLCAQTSQATLQGVVQDPTGAAVPGAKVTVTNVSTGVVREITSGPDGRYTIGFLFPGSYRLTVEHTGFRRFEQTGINLDVEQTLTANPELQVGDVTTAVQVTAAAPPLATSDATVGTTVGNESITDLPLNGRLVVALAAIVPGVYTGVSSASVQNNNYTPQIGGGRIMTSETTLDGAPLSVIDPTGGARVMGGLPPSPDAVQEFTVEINNVPAEYGRLGGGVINIATKSGTNGVHGTVREFFRNSALDANDFFANKYGEPLLSFHRNQFGVSVGGPVYIPRVYHGKNRTFFFVDDDITRQSSPATTTTTMPIDAWRSGNFSSLLNYQGQPITIYDPLTTQANGSGGYTRTPFPGNIIPAGRISPVALNILPFWPEPNSASTNQFQPTNNFYGAGKAVLNASNLTIRVDQNWSDAWRSYWRLNYSTLNEPAAQTTGSAAEAAYATVNPRWNGVWDNTIVVNPTTTIDLRANVSRWTYDLTPTTVGFNSDKLGLPSYLSAEAAQNWLNFPGVGVSGVWGMGGGGGVFWHSNSGNPSASLTKITGKHTIKAGGEYRKYWLNFYQPWGAGPNGGFNFDSTWTQQDPFAYSSTGGFGFGSFLLGVPTSGDEWIVPKVAFASSYWAGYVQDDFRVTPKLTLNYGLRYDIDTVRTERYNRMSFYDLGAASPIAGEVPGFPNLVGAMEFMSPSHRQQTAPEYTQFAPRFGFAYQVNQKTVVRGGYGMFYDASPMQAANHNAGLEGFRLETPMIVSVNGLTPTNTLSNPWPNGFKTASQSPSTDLGSAIGESYIPVPEETPRIQEWNVTVQRELPGSLILELGYIGNTGHHLQDGDSMEFDQLPISDLALGSQLNQSVANPFAAFMPSTSALSAPTVLASQLLRPYPQITSLQNYWRPYGNSNYQSFTLRAQRRFSGGLGFLVAFTGGKLLGDSEASGFFSSSGGNAVQNVYDRAAEKAVSTEDVARRLVVTADYQLPVGTGKRFLSSSNRFVDAVLGGWQLNGIWTWQTGQPIPITQPVNQTYIYTATQRPTTDGQAIVCTGGSTNGRISDWFSTSGLSITAPFTLGNLGRTTTSCREPGLANFDASLFKTFSILSENRLKAQFRLEGFNVFNTPQFGRVNSTIGSTSTGSITSDAVEPRQMQLALKLIF
jgi:hypothetical protein